MNICHCSQCRRTSGHLWAATRCDVANITFQADATLKWYASSSTAKRGFCSRCGSSLFYKPNDADHMAIAAGCITEPSGLVLQKHIFIKDKGDYYPTPTDADLVERW